MPYAVSDLRGYYKSWLALLGKIQFADQDDIYMMGNIVEHCPASMLLLQNLRDGAMFGP